MVLVRLRTTPDARGFGTHEQFGFAPCGIREATGVKCPTCGVTTSVSHAVRGEFVEAFWTQPLGLLLPPLVALLCIAAVRGHLAGDDLALRVARVQPRFWALAVAVVVTCWLVAL